MIKNCCLHILISVTVGVFVAQNAFALPDDMTPEMMIETLKQVSSSQQVGAKTYQIAHCIHEETNQILYSEDFKIKVTKCIEDQHSFDTVPERLEECDRIPDEFLKTILEKCNPELKKEDAK